MRRVINKFSDTYKEKMKQRRFHAVTASIGLHILFALIVALLLSEQRILDNEAFEATLVKLNPTNTKIEIRPTHRTVTVNPTLTTEASSPRTPTQVSRIRQLPKEQTAIVREVPKFDDALDPVEVADVPTLSNVETPNAASAHSSIAPAEAAPTIERTASPTIRNRETTDTGFTEFLDGSLSTGGLDGGADITLRYSVKIPKEKLGGVLEGTGNEIRGHIRLIRLQHSLSDWWQDPTAIPSLIKWLEDHTPIRADMDFEGGALRLTDPQILDAPLIIMTGHDKDITVGRGLVKDGEGPLQTGFTPKERAALREYIVEKGGMLFFDDCGFNGLFAHVFADELRQIFPEYPLEILPHDHEIYSIHYHLPKPPTGGDVFWGNENNAQPTQFRFQKGIIIDNRLAVVYNRKDYLCAMETAEIESRTMLRLRRSTDVYRFMSNLLIYALKYGGNTDRTGYTE